MRNNILIVMPTFNESSSIEKTITSIMNEKIALDILIVDDDSPDGTSDIVISLQKQYSNLYLLTKKEDKGFARAYISGFQYALDNNYQKVIQMDADGSHQSMFLSNLIQESSKYNYVIGSRWTKGGSVHNWPLHRFLISRAGNLYSRIMLRTRVKDVTGGYKIIDTELLKEMDIHSINARGYSFQIELFLRARKLNAKITEVPIAFIEREEGVSKMSKDIIKEAMLFVTKQGLGIGNKK